MIPDFETFKYLDDILTRKCDANEPDFSFSETAMKILEERKINGIDSQYEISNIPKGNGKMRVIEAPNDDLKKVQRRTLRLLNQVHLPEKVHGFRQNSGTIQGLRHMLDDISKKMDKGGTIGSVFQTDLENFFPSIKEDWVEDSIYHFLYRTLHRSENGPQLSRNIIKDLSGLITELSCINGRLPQGAPTSPILSNIVGVSKFDRAIIRNLGDDMEYGRYADDIIIMGVNKIPKKDRNLVISILESSGFKIARDKTEYFEGRKNFNVWGLNVITEKCANGYRLRFKIPKNKEVSWAKEILDFTKEGWIPEKPNELSNNEQVQKIFGRLGYAYNVTKSGTNKEHLGFTLPRQLAFAWNIFRNQYSKFMTANMLDCFGKGITSNVRKEKDKSAKNIEKFNKNAAILKEVEILNTLGFSDFKDLSKEIIKETNIIKEIYLKSRLKVIDFDTQLQKYFDESISGSTLPKRKISIFIAFAKLHLSGSFEKGSYTLEDKYILPEELFYSLSEEFVDIYMKDIKWEIIKIFKKDRYSEIKTERIQKTFQFGKTKNRENNKKTIKDFFYCPKIED